MRVSIRASRRTRSSPAAQPAPSSAVHRHVRSGRSSALSPKQGARFRTPRTDPRDPRIPRAGLAASRGPDALCAAGREGPRGAGQSPGSGSTCAIPTRARGPARTKRRCGSLPSGWLLWNETIGPKQHARSRCCLSNAIIGEPTRETESTLGGAQVAPPPGADVLLRFPMRGAARRGGDPDRPEGAIVPPISIRLSLSSHVRRASTAIALATEKSSG